TNFLARVAGQQKWLAVGRATPLDFAQAAVAAYLAGNVSPSMKEMEESAKLVGCERPTNATNIVSLLFSLKGTALRGGVIFPGELKYHCRFRTNYLTLLTVESFWADTRTIAGDFVSDDHYDPPGFERNIRGELWPSK